VYIWRVGLHPDRGTGVTVPSKAPHRKKLPVRLFLNTHLWMKMEGVIMKTFKHSTASILSAACCAVCGVLLLAGCETSSKLPTHKENSSLQQKLRREIVPKVQIQIPEASKDAEQLLTPIIGESYARRIACSNKNKFSIYAKNLTQLELVDLVFSLSDTSYAFENNGLIVAPTNMPPFYLRQNSVKEKEIIAKIKGMTIPEIFPYHPATAADVVEFLYQATEDYDDIDIPIKERGVNFALKNPQFLLPLEERKPRTRPPIPDEDGWRYSTIYDTLTNFCTKVHAQFIIRDNTIVIYPATGTNSPVYVR